MSVRVILNSINGELTVTDNFFSWAEKNNEISRSETYTGVIMTTSLEMKFGGDAFTYIMNLNDEFDIAAECTALIQYYDDLNGWVDDFDGFIDLKTIPQDNEGGNTVTVSAFSSQLADKLLEFEGTKIPYDRLTTLNDEVITPFDNEYIEVDVIGMDIIDFNTLSIIDSGSISLTAGTPSVSNLSILENWHSIILQTVGNDFGANGLAPNEEWVNERMWFESINLTGTISGTITVTYTVGGSGSNQTLKIYDYKELLPFEVVSIPASGGWTPFPPETIEIPIDYTIDENTRLVFVFSSADAFTNFELTENDLKLVSIATSTPCNFVPPIQALNRTVNAITGEANSIESDFFDLDLGGIGALSFLANGRLMRQFPIGNIQPDEETKVAQLNFSFKNLYENLNNQFNLGVGVFYDEDESRYKIIIEEKEYFFQETIVLEIPADVIVKDSYKRIRDLDFYYNEIESGYNYEKLQDTGGLTEYNSLINSSTPAANENKLNIISEYVGSGYVMESARRTVYEATETTDNKYDNNNLIFNVYDNSGTYIQRTTEGFVSITGIDDIENPLNLILTGKRAFNRWGWWIKTGLRGYPDGVIKYNTSEITTKLATQLTTESNEVIENADTPINEIEAPKFSGFINSFVAPLGSAAFKLLQANPYAIIKHWDFFTNDWKFSWIRRASNQPSDKSSNFELIEAFNFVEGDGFRILQDGGYRLLEDGGLRKIV